MAATRWRLNVTANNGDANSLELAELQMRAAVGGADQCAGGAATASTNYTSYPAANAFDDSASTAWITAWGTTTGWIEYAFAGAVDVVEYAFMPRSTQLDRAPTAWTFEYWDGAAWVVVDTRSGETSWSGGVFNVYAITPFVVGLLSGKIVVRSAATAELSGLLEVNTATTALDGAAVVRDAAAGLLDGSAQVFSTAAPGLDGALSIEKTWLLDGALEVWQMDKSAWRDYAPVSSWSLPFATPKRAIFVVTLRADGLADLEVPVSSLQMRRRDGYPTMISCVVPDADTYYDDAAARVNGELIVTAGSATADGTRHLSELERVTLEDISYDVGVANSSMTLVGYRTETNANPRPVGLTFVTYVGLQADGKWRVRCSINIFLRPGDTAVCHEASFTVEQIYVWVAADNSWMEVAGA
jgi:hypothetical protein